MSITDLNYKELVIDQNWKVIALISSNLLEFHTNLIGFYVKKELVDIDHCY